MFCNYCGAPNPDDTAFCRGCGRARGAALPPASSAPAPTSVSAPAEPAVRTAASASPFGILAVALVGLAIIAALGLGIATFMQERRQTAEREAASVRALDAAIDNANFHVAGTDQPKAPSAAPARTIASLAFPPDGDDPNAITCDRLADHPLDPLRIGDGVQSPLIDIAQALPVCQQAASATPARPRYQFLYGRVLDVAGRVEEAVQQYTLAERAGYVFGDLNLGLVYRDGQGVTRNVDTAIAFLSRAYSGGVPDARAYIGDLYANASPPDYVQAKAQYEEAITANAPEGYAGLAILYDLGQGVVMDRAKGAELARKAAELGNINGMFWLGRHLKDGQGVDRDPAAACGWFDKTARAKYAYGQLEAGRCFYTGDGGIKNHEYAFYWLIRAAEAGLPEAQELVGDMYDGGDGVGADESQAVEWYRRAAVQGDLYGMFQLAAHLRQGKGVAWSEAEAMEWFEKAAKGGFAAAQSSLAQGYVLGLGQDAGQGHRDYDEAAHWFAEAAKQGEGLALLNLGVMYENGWGVSRDLDRAKQLYTQAAQSSNAAAARMGQQYAAGLSAPATDDSPQPSSLVRTKNEPTNADAWVAIIVGAVALGAVAEILGHSGGGSSDSSSVDTSSSTPWTPPTTTTEFSWPSSSDPTPAPAPLHPYYPYQQWKTPNGDLTNPNLAWR